MLNQMKLMGMLAGLMKNQDRLVASAQRVRTALSATRVTGEAGGGAARATFTCDMKLVAVELSPSLACGLDDDANRAIEVCRLLGISTGEMQRDARALAAIPEHAELASQVEELGRAVAICAAATLPASTRLERLSLVEFPPVRELRQWPLVDGAR